MKIIPQSLMNDLSIRFSNYHNSLIELTISAGKKTLRILRELSAFLFFLTIALLYLSILLSFLPIIKIFSGLFYEARSLSFHFFVSSLATLIEFVLFDIILLLLASGIYVCILEPLAGEKAFSIEKMFKDFIAYLSSPFLMVVSSILIVSIFEIIIELYSSLSDRFIPETGFMAEDGFRTYFNLKLILIVFIFIAIVSISLLMRIEKTIIHSNDSESQSAESNLIKDKK